MATPTGLAVSSNRIIFSNDASAGAGGSLNLSARVGEVTGIDLTALGDTLLWTSVNEATVVEAVVQITALSGLTSDPSGKIKTPAFDLTPAVQMRGLIGVGYEYHFAFALPRTTQDVPALTTVSLEITTAAVATTMTAKAWLQVIARA